MFVFNSQFSEFYRIDAAGILLILPAVCFTIGLVVLSFSVSVTVAFGIPALLEASVKLAISWITSIGNIYFASFGIAVL